MNHLKEFDGGWGLIREAANKKKGVFLVVGPLRPLPPPSGLVVIGTFCIALKKVVFLLVVRGFTPPPLSGTNTKKTTFFAASLR